MHNGVIRLKQIIFAAGLLAGSFGLTNCSRPGPPSPIVQKAQAAGAGDLATTSDASMSQWLAKNPNVAKEIEGMCKPVRKSASATWGDTTEGRLCKASGRVAFFAPSQTTGDDRKFGAGNH
jgi:hypothetical protein